MRWMDPSSCSNYLLLLTRCLNWLLVKIPCCVKRSFFHAFSSEMCSCLSFSTESQRKPSSWRAFCLTTGSFGAFVSDPSVFSPLVSSTKQINELTELLTVHKDGDSDQWEESLLTCDSCKHILLRFEMLTGRKCGILTINVKSLEQSTDVQVWNWPKLQKSNRSL